MKKFNRPSIELFPIKHNPFDEYDIVSPPQPEERNLTIAQIIKVRDCKVKPGGPGGNGRNMALLSFYLCGMNAKDFHNNTYKIKNDRIEYCRSKTTGRRNDRAFISIKIPEEALSLLEFAAIISIRYATIGNFNKALSKR